MTQGLLRAAASRPGSPAVEVPREPRLEGAAPTGGPRGLKLTGPSLRSLEPEASLPVTVSPRVVAWLSVSQLINNREMMLRVQACGGVCSKRGVFHHPLMPSGVCATLQHPYILFYTWTRKMCF